MNELNNLITQHFRKEGLGDIHEELARIVIEEILPWKVEDTGHPGRSQIIIGFAFGFVCDPNGNRKPGKINRLLADAVLEYYKRKPRPVYLQWEIAESLRGEIEERHLHVLYPTIGLSGEIEYLSTQGVLEAVAGKLGIGNLRNAGSVLIVAHRDHLPRCVHLARRMGFQAVAVQSQMPAEYDPSSAQYWTRDRKTYIISDLISRLAALRNE